LLFRLVAPSPTEEEFGLLPLVYEVRNSLEDEL